MAQEAYLKTKGANLLEDPRNLPILVYAKFVSDYQLYLGANVKANIDFLNQIVVFYKDNRELVNGTLFKKHQWVAQEMISKTCAVAAAVTQPGAAAAVPGAAVAAGAAAAAVPTQPVPRSIQHELSRLMDIYKTAIQTLVTHKVMFYDVYKNRNTDLVFLNIPKFAPVLLYAKYIEDNKQQIESIDPIIKREAFSKLFPNFTEDQTYYVQGLHIQAFIILASNLYNIYRSDFNAALLS
jgi:hypothetical protein